MVEEQDCIKQVSFRGGHLSSLGWKQNVFFSYIFTISYVSEFFIHITISRVIEVVSGIDDWALEGKILTWPPSVCFGRVKQKWRISRPPLPPLLVSFYKMQELIKSTYTTLEAQVFNFTNCAWVEKWSKLCGIRRVNLW